MPLTTIYEGHCISDVRDVALWAVIIGSLSLPCLFIGPSFQYAKFYKTRSADGVSALTLATGSVARGLTVVNLVILHYDQMVMCYNSKNPPPWYKCQSSFLVLYSGALGFVAYFPQYVVLAGLIDKEKEPTYYSQARWGGTIIFVILLSVALPVAASFSAGTCHASEGYAVVIGFISTLFLCLQFTPQLYTSLLYKSAGSMSYITYLLDVVGGVIILQAKLFGTREDISTWLPTLIMHAFELVIVLVNLYNDYHRGVLKYSILSECYFLPTSWRSTSPRVWKSEVTPLIKVQPTRQAPSARRAKADAKRLYIDYVDDHDPEEIAPDGWELPVTPRVQAEGSTGAGRVNIAMGTWETVADSRVELEVDPVLQSCDRASARLNSAKPDNIRGDAL